MEYKIIQEFIGEINTVQIQDKNVYYSTIFILEQLENKFDCLTIHKEFIKILSETIETLYFKIDSFSYAELEQDFTFAIERADTIQNLAFDYCGTDYYLEDLNAALQTLDNPLEHEESFGFK